METTKRALRELFRYAGLRGMVSLFADLPIAALLAVHTHHLPFHFRLSAQPVIALVAGIFILIRPRLLNFIVAVYLILIGLMGLFGLPW